MDKKKASKPIPLKNVCVDDGFWKQEMELVRTEVLPYQWETLNDRVEGAAPSFCMRNFKVAGKLVRQRKKEGESFQEPKYTFRGFESLPEDMNHLEDKFYGFVFQDSDFSKWIEAAAYSLISHPDEKLEKIADEAIDIVCAAQLENGYLDTYYIINGMDKSFTNLKDNHELYCFGHLTEGAVAYYQATGKDKLLQAAVRFADYLITCFGEEEGKKKGYPGHEIAEMALVRLYEATGEEKYLNLSRFFLNQRGTKPYYYDMEQNLADTEGERYAYNQAHLPVREQSEAVGHAVRAMYLYSGMADVARLTEDEEMWEACRRLWHSTVNEKMYITGGVGGTHIGEAFSFPFDLPNDTAYAETCASIGLMFWARRMLEAEPDAAYADVMELALYNTVLSGMDLDGKSFFYVNPLEVLPEACHKDERKFHVKPVRQKWFGCACCPPNLARVLSSIPSYAFTETADTLFLHLYMGCTVKKVIDGKETEIKITSGFPWNGKVSVEVTGKPPAAMKLALRIPGWCEEWKIEVPKNKETRVEQGYYYIEGTWNPGERVEIDFPMEVKVMQADDRVREDLGKVALMKGPVVYCMEEADNGAGLHKNYICLPLTSVQEENVEINGQVFPALKVPGKKKVGRDFGNSLYREYQKPEYQDTKLLLIPYFTWANRGENEMSVWLREYFQKID